MKKVIKLTEQEFKNVIENTILKETGEWIDDDEGLSWKEYLENEVKKIEDKVHFFKLIEIRGFDKYQGPYASVKILNKFYEIWTVENNILWIEDFPIDNTSGPETTSGFMGTPQQIIDMLYLDYYDKALSGDL